MAVTSTQEGFAQPAQIALWPDAGPAIVVGEGDYAVLATLWERHGSLLLSDAESDQRALAHLFRRQLSPGAQLTVGCVARILAAARRAGQLPPKDAVGAAPSAASIATLIGQTDESVLESAFEGLYTRELSASGRSKRDVLLDALTASLSRRGG